MVYGQSDIGSTVCFDAVADFLFFCLTLLMDWANILSLEYMTLEIFPASAQDSSQKILNLIGTCNTLNEPRV
jgi:hypothetical protein